jgi:hypothetical protein
MPRIAATLTLAAGMKDASFLLTDSDPDCVYGDPRRIARATRAGHAGRQSGRRRFVDPTTNERDYGAAELEFMRAIEEYKHRSGRKFPTWSEVLEVLQSLGYEKATGHRAMPGVGSATFENVTP